MIPYWIMFGVPAFATLFERRGRMLGNRNDYVFFVLATLLICLLVGLRYQVGGDWSGYIQYLWRAGFTEFYEIPFAGDPGYVLINWIAARLGADVWFVNLVCGALFSWGLLRFALDQPRPWLALTVAIPYLVLVVAMGYTRQSVAIGLAMCGLVALGSGKSNLKFVLWIMVAAAFHKSAVLLIPVAALAEKQGRLWTAFWVGSATLIAYFTLLESSVDSLVTGYLESNYDSAGAAIRVIMNALPAAILVVYRKRFSLRPRERTLWLVLASIALALVPLLYLSPSSTAVDRVALYLIPLQLMVLSRIPDTFAKSQSDARFLAIVIVAYSAAVQFVWLTFATHAELWLPYQFFPF